MLRAAKMTKVFFGTLTSRHVMVLSSDLAGHARFCVPQVDCVAVDSVSLRRRFFVLALTNQDLFRLLDLREQEKMEWEWLQGRGRGRAAPLSLSHSLVRNRVPRGVVFRLYLLPQAV